VLASSWADDPDTLQLLRDRATNDPDEDGQKTALQAIGVAGLISRRVTSTPASDADSERATDI
jgi:hypothetical protein